MLATSQLNGICHIWDLNVLSVKEQLLAHEKQVNYLTFTSNQNEFATAGQDGQVRLFDLRALQTSTIAFQSDRPITQVHCNKSNPYQLALVLEDANTVLMLDTRYSSTPQPTLSSENVITTAGWLPGQSILCSADEGS